MGSVMPEAGFTQPRIRLFDASLSMVGGAEGTWHGKEKLRKSKGRWRHRIDLYLLFPLTETESKFATDANLQSQNQNGSLSSLTLSEITPVKSHNTSQSRDDDDEL